MASSSETRRNVRFAHLLGMVLAFSARAVAQPAGAEESESERDERYAEINAVLQGRAEPSQGPQLYRNPEYGFEIDIPSGWTMKYRAFPGTLSGTLVEAVYPAKRLAMLTIAAHPGVSVQRLEDLDDGALFELAVGKPGEMGAHLERLDSGHDKIAGQDWA
jgi:hypothetical protein